MNEVLRINKLYRFFKKLRRILHVKKHTGYVTDESVPNIPISQMNEYMKHKYDLIPKTYDYQENN